MKKTVNILGTLYTIESSLDITSRLKEENLDGSTDFISKHIEILDYTSMLPEDNSLDHKKVAYNNVLRHELTHAFFHEAGLDNYAYDETLVDFIAMQFSKLKDLFKNQEV